MSKSRIEKEAEELFGEMRDATEEEQKALSEWIRKSYESTGIKLEDIIDEIN